MLKNYLIIALRNLLKHKLYSAINIAGLTLGIAAFISIMFYVRYQRSYDSFWPDLERLYRIRYERTDASGESVKFASCCPPAAPLIKARYPEVEGIVRIFKSRANVAVGEKDYYEEGMYFAEAEFPDILKFKMMEGDRTEGLKGTNKVFLSKSIAKKYFGEDKSIGKSISLDKSADYMVTGVFEDIPHNSHLKFDILLSFENLINKYGPDYFESWGETGCYTYIRVKPEADIAALQGKLLGLADQEIGEFLRSINMKMELKLQAVKDIHLNSHFMQEYEVNGDKDSVDFLSYIAAFILILAWVNYVNLTTAKAFSRSKEVGIRKVSGASRWQLMGQFFLEAGIVNLAAVMLTIGLIELILPVFGNVTGIPAELVLLQSWWFLWTLAGVLGVGIILSGIIPAVILSSFTPADAIRSRFISGIRGVSLRKTLVIFQFTSASILIIGTLAMYLQIRYMKNQKLGFDITQTLVVKAPRVKGEDFPQKAEIFKQEMLKNPQISRMCLVSEVPGKQLLWDAGGIYKAGADPSQMKNYQIMGVDYNFMDVFKVKLLNGRNFSREFADSSSLIFNETAVRWMGFSSPDSALGQKVNYWDEIFTIVGVVEDYHQQSPKTAYEPTIFRLQPFGRGGLGMFALKVNSVDAEEVIHYVGRTYKELFPGNPYHYFFLDEYFNRQYQSDELMLKVFLIFTILAVIVNCLGIMGLSSFMTERRTKEIGVRKILGAGTRSILMLISKEFFILAAAACIIGWPIAYYFLKWQIRNYANRIEIGWEIFICASLFLMITAIGTVIITAYRPAVSNPVKALRYE